MTGCLLLFGAATAGAAGFVMPGGADANTLMQQLSSHQKAALRQMQNQQTDHQTEGAAQPTPTPPSVE